MIDIGLRGPEDYEMLRRTLQIIDLVGQLRDELPADPVDLGDPGSEIDRLRRALPESPVDIRRTFFAALRTTRLRAQGPVVGGGISVHSPVGVAPAIAVDLPCHRRRRAAQTAGDHPTRQTSGDPTRDLLTLPDGEMVLPPAPGQRADTHPNLDQHIVVDLH